MRANILESIGQFEEMNYLTYDETKKDTGLTNGAPFVRPYYAVKRKIIVG